MSRAGFKTVSVTDEVYNRLVKHMGIATAEANRRVSLTEVINRALDSHEAQRQFVFVAPGRESH